MVALYVTDKEIKRYFCDPDAVSLVIEAGEMSSGGEVLFLIDR